MNARNPWRLSAMMALVYAVQGSFWPLLAIHLADLGIGGRDRGWIFATLAIGSTAVPLGAGQLVDRLMATQRRAGDDLRPRHGAAGDPGLGAGSARRAGCSRCSWSTGA